MRFYIPKWFRRLFARKKPKNQPTIVNACAAMESKKQQEAHKKRVAHNNICFAIHKFTNGDNR